MNGADLATEQRDVDAREARTSRVSVLYGEITAATREFLRAVLDCDRHEDWKQEGFPCCADWLAVQIGVSRGTAREKVRAARALEGLPLISGAMDRGEISFSKVRALTRVATPESEAELLAYARSGSTATLERLVRSWKTLGREDEARLERIRHGTRRLSVFQDNDGMYVVRGLVTPEVGALLMRAVEAASDALFSETTEDACERPEPAQLRADALGLVAERALAAGFGGVAASGAEEADDAGEAVDGSERDAPISGSRAERYQVMLHVGPDTLTEATEPGMSELEDGTRVSAETSRRICCDASRVDVWVDEGGSVLDVGRKTRTVPPSIRRALEARDRGCRFPGCGLRFTDAHHIVHWADGGETSLANLVLLCARHHRAVHEGGTRVFSDSGGQVLFYAPDGRAFGDATPVPELGPDPVGSLIGRNRERGVRPDWGHRSPEASGRCGQRFNDGHLPFEIEVAAWEALERAE